MEKGWKRFATKVCKFTILARLLELNWSEQEMVYRQTHHIEYRYPKPFPKEDPFTSQITFENQLLILLIFIFLRSTANTLTLHCKTFKDLSQWKGSLFLCYIHMYMHVLQYIHMHQVQRVTTNRKHDLHFGNGGSRPAPRIIQSFKFQVIRKIADCKKGPPKCSITTFNTSWSS